MGEGKKASISLNHFVFSVFYCNFTPLKLVNHHQHKVEHLLCRHVKEQKDVRGPGTGQKTSAMVHSLTLLVCDKTKNISHGVKVGEDFLKLNFWGGIFVRFAIKRSLSLVSLQLECPMIIAAIFVTGIGGTFQYGFCVSVMNAPSAVRTFQHP